MLPDILVDPSVPLVLFEDTVGTPPPKGVARIIRMVPYQVVKYKMYLKVQVQQEHCASATLN